jgi:hypothetical protein
MNDLPSIVGLIAASFTILGCLCGYLVATWHSEEERMDAFEQGRQLGFQEGCKRIERYHNSPKDL